MKTILLVTAVSIILTNIFVFAAPNSQVKQYLSALKDEIKKNNQSFQDFNPKNGRKIFTSKRMGKRGKMISCTTCHGLDLSKRGKNERTGKIIKPMAPSANPKALTKVKNIKKWIRRNFRDVYQREGTPQEKGDVLKYLLAK